MMPLIGLCGNPSTDVPSQLAPRRPANASASASPKPGISVPSQPKTWWARFCTVVRPARSAGVSSGCGQSGTPSIESSQRASCGFW